MQDSGMEDGFVFQGARYEGGVVNGLEYIRTSGGDVIDPEDPEKVVIDSSGAVEDGIAPKAVSTYAEQECQAAFLNGRADFCRNWPYMYALATGEGQSRLESGQAG